MYLTDVSDYWSGADWLLVIVEERFAILMIGKKKSLSCLGVNNELTSLIHEETMTKPLRRKRIMI